MDGAGGATASEDDGTAVDLVGDEVVTNLARAALLAALTGALAVVGSIPIPVSPAPVSLQPFGAFLAGLLLGPAWGALSMVLYLAAGAVGAPVFAGGAAGPGVLVGATAGYLWGFPVAAAVIGAVAHGGAATGDPSEVPLARVVAGLVAGTVVLYAMGVAGLVVVLDLSPRAAVVSGALVFVPGEVVKMAAAAGIVRSEALADALAAG